jgi:hypothetical protein
VRALDGSPALSKVSHISTNTIAGFLFVLIGVARANEADDKISRLIAQARQQAAVHASLDVANTVGKITELLSDASLESLDAVLNLMNEIRRMRSEAPGESTQSATSSDPINPAAKSSREPSAPDFLGLSDRPASLSSEPPLAVPAPPAADPPLPALSLASPPAASIAVSPPRPALSRAPVALLDLLQRQGDAALRTGDISGARRFYQRGADAGCGACADALAQTYDADQLRRMGTVGIKADPAQAEAWRTRARELTQSKPPR